MPRIYPNPDAEGRVGIPVDGEIYSKDDASRLIGQGIARGSKPAHRERPEPPPEDIPVEGKEEE